MDSYCTKREHNCHRIYQISCRCLVSFIAVLNSFQVLKEVFLNYFCPLIAQLLDVITDFVSLYDGVCDETKQMEKLTGLVPPNIFSTSGHNLFIRFGISEFSKPGFSAKIHFGNYILTYVNK